MEKIANRPQPSLKSRALRLLSRREHSRFELEQCLGGFEESPGTLAQVLDELQAKGFISEQRVLESVVHRHAAKLGVARIRQQLLAKGLEPEAVAQAVEQLRSNEVERAREVWRKKFGTPPAYASEYARQVRFLASRGEVIRKVVNGDAEDV
jgi:regulatory protein